ncbi:MAG: cytochrome c3 family protein [Planctomycetota bacterium]|jgi:hypothetical protein
MSLKSPRFWIVMCSLVIVMTVGLADVRRTSPGELAAVHGAKVELAKGWGSCSQCHGGWFQSMAEACLECHEPIGKQVETGDGFHGALGRTKGMECGKCHSDHHGTDFAIVNQASFAEAGFENAYEFDHEFIGFKMDGKHLEQTCDKCHENANIAVLPEGQTRFIGLEQDCAKCHEDPHEGKMVLACAQCHSQVAFDQFASLDHAKHLPLTGGHAKVSCRECHKKEEPHALEALGSGAQIKRRACLDCHESPHDETFIGRVATRAEELPSKSCGTCHLPDHVSFKDERLTVSPELHALSGFGLNAPHNEVACEKCHADRRSGPDADPDFSNFRARHPGRDPDTCSACHEDPHGEQFGERACLECHKREHFKPHDYTVKKHNEAKFALTGSHVEAECASCHKVAKEGTPRTFVGTTETCSECHEDAHLGFFDRRAGKTVACSDCHKPTTFAAKADEPFDHAEWTGFELRGAHLQDGCESCHTRSEKPNELGRAFGRVEDRFGKFESCGSCHKDPHDGEFDKPGRPAVIKGRTSCARCHDDTSFRTLTKFDHGVWTGFALVGNHLKATCADCHTPLKRPDERGRRGAPAKGRHCADCHEDNHAGQFKKNGETSCEDCHRGATSFRDISFRHDVDSRFKLGDAHRKVACDKCHKPDQIGAKTVIRYRPLGTQCVDCHGAAKDPLRRKRRKVK